MIAVHLTFATRGREPVAPGEGLRRAVVRAILRVAGDRVVLFCVVDDHVHVVLLCEPHRVGLLARSLLLALRAISPASVEPAHVRPVATRAHAEWLVGYLLGQTGRHGLDEHAAIWSGSCFAELAGARAVDGWRWNVRELLPRFRLREAFAAVGLSRAIAPASDTEVRALGAWRLAAAASFAAGADPALKGNAPAEVAARRVVARVGGAIGIATQEVADALGVEVRMVARIGARDVPAALARATRVRLALEEVVRTAQAGGVGAGPGAGSGAASGAAPAPKSGGKPLPPEIAHRNGTEVVG